MKHNKPIIESLINTIAIALTSYGVLEIQKQNLYGYLAIGFAMALEFGKYWGRKNKFW